MRDFLDNDSKIFKKIKGHLLKKNSSLVVLIRFIELIINLVEIEFGTVRFCAAPASGYEVAIFFTQKMLFRLKSNSRTKNELYYIRD